MVDYESFINQVKDYLYNDILNNLDHTFNKYINNDLEKAKEFKNKITNTKKELEEDLKFFLESDPAIDNSDEVIQAYPGYKAITYYRVAHVLREMGYKLESRMITEMAHSLTGIDIHPGASISYPFFIDHGTGIVIGETTIIGRNVKIYQGATLGALSLSKGSALKGTKRHPTIGNDVTIYSGASILGNITIGDDVTIGSNVFIVDDVPSQTMVTIGKPILIFKKKDN